MRVTDLCVNSILFRANRDLRWLALKLGKHEEATEIEQWLDAGFEGFNTLWDEEAGLYKCQDQITGELADAGISAAFLPLFAGNFCHVEQFIFIGSQSHFSSQIERHSCVTFPTMPS